MTTTGMIPNGIDHRFHGLPHPVVPSSFRSWRAGVVRSGRLPIIAVAGLRGKTTIIRLLDHIIKTAGHKTALWTSTGVEINGRPQVGELGAWKEALGRVMDGDVSVAIQELEWATVLAAGLPPGFYPDRHGHQSLRERRSLFIASGGPARAQSDAQNHRGSRSERRDRAEWRGFHPC